MQGLRKFIIKLTMKTINTNGENLIMKKEIERKFIISEMPKNLDLELMIYIKQTYLALGEEEVRVRHEVEKDENKYYIIIKKGKGMIKEKLDLEINESTYLQLLKNTNKKPIIKTRYKTKYDKHYILIDYFLDMNLIIAEIEFKNEQDALDFCPPKWFSKEVTDDDKYKNQYLWRTINNLI
jgi:adenylate cyclase